MVFFSWHPPFDDSKCSGDLLIIFIFMKNKIQVFFVHGGMTFKNQPDYLNFLKTREVSIEKKAYWSHEYLQNKIL